MPVCHFGLNNPLYTFVCMSQNKYVYARVVIRLVDAKPNYRSQNLWQCQRTILLCLYLFSLGHSKLVADKRLADLGHGAPGPRPL